MRGAGGAGVLAPGESHPFPPVRFPAPPTWRWHIQAPVPAHRVTLAESLLHCGPQFPHLYRGGGGVLEKSGISGAAPEREDAPEATSRGCAGAPALEPQPASTSGAGAAGSDGWDPPEGSADPSRLRERRAGRGPG